MKFRRGGNSTAPVGVMYSGLAGKSEKPTCQRPRNDAEGGVLRACKNATLRRICCGAIVEPRGGTYYRVISVRPMRGDSETSPGRPTEPGRGFFFASSPPIPAPWQIVRAGLKPPLQMVSGFVGAGPQKTQRVFWGAPHCLALF